MTRIPPQRTNTNPVFRLLATGIAIVVAVLLFNSVTGSNGSSDVSAASLLTIPGGNNDAEPPLATTAPMVPTTPPLQLPTATATPLPTATMTPPPTATSLPTAIPTAPPPTSPPAPAPATNQPSVSVADAGASAQPTATVAAAPQPTAQPTVAPTLVPATATAVPTVAPTEIPTVEPTAVIVVEPTEIAVEPTPAPTPSPTPVPLSTIADLENYVLGEINDVRAKAGLGPLVMDSAASSIARDWSQQMATGGFFSHRPGDELSAMLPSGWRQWGENIASAPDIFWAQSSLEQSPGHYANMVGAFSHVGIGVYRIDGQVWVTQNFVRY